MRKYFLPIVLAFLSVACTVDEDFESGERVNPDIQLPFESGDDSGIDVEVFELINLDYPGLERVKEAYEAGNIYAAGAALLDYYRLRTDVTNPNVNSFPSIVENDRTKADNATLSGEYRFYVNGNYYSFLKDGGIDWEANPENLDDQEYDYQRYRFQWMESQAKVYAATGDEKYAQAWIGILDSFMDRFGHLDTSAGTQNGGDGRKRVADDYVWIGLQTAERLEAILNSFFYYVNSPAVTPAELSMVLLAVAKHADCSMDNPWYETKSNIAVKCEKAVLSAGIYMPELKHASAWSSYGVETLTWQLSPEGSFNVDGVQNELDPSYHFAVISDLRMAYLLGKENGVQWPEEYLEGLRKACHFVKDIVYPDLTVECFNDTRSTASSVIQRYFREYYEMFPDEDEFIWMSRLNLSNQQGHKPSTDLKVYDRSGYYMFRNDWGKASTMLVLKNNYNPQQAWHCQEDNGHFGIYSNGRNFSPDPGAYDYNEPNRSRYAHTGRHNTMTVGDNAIDRSRMLGECLITGKIGNTEYAVIQNASYDNLTHRRAVFFVEKKFFVIVDEGYGEAEVKDVRVNFNLCDSSKETVDAYDGSAFGAHTGFEDASNMIFKTFAEFSGSRTYSTQNDRYSVSYYKLVEKPRTKYYVSVDKPAGKAARFITVLYPFGDASEFSGIDIKAEFTDNAGSQAGTFHPDGASVKVTVGNREYPLSYTITK